MGKHTPGIWRRCKHGGAPDRSSIHVETDAPHESGWFLEISAGYTFEKMADPEEAEAEFKANCDLALAGTQMLEALQAAAPHESHTGPIMIGAEIVELIRAAITAAEQEADHD